ncbi:MAG TPA: sn-glycerol-3-phosphate ABC transporter ATP-binding protein UgpC [Acidimicrobiales bacterium]|jgi:multiple sugar transport system ATP-binding protein|nr:sn-glycerol-3-phosphate ABC transporter ATP-binding protein UgpC [Acidimicrobiales bacterium]
MASITLQDLTKEYSPGVPALSHLNLDVVDGEFMVLVGPSGCGKTTALRMVAGLEEVTSGTIIIGDRIVNGMPPRDRDIAMVFQNYALYPHMTVAENIGFSLTLAKLNKAEIAERVGKAAGILGLTELLDRKPALLSGGQRQRVAMGRAIVREPSAFLMDEPLSNLDAKLRVQMRAEISRIQRRLAVATLYVTHDQTEAMTMGDRVAVLQAGILQQCDAPQVLYDRPANIFVAAFIGSPSMNLYEGSLSDDGEQVRLGGQYLTLPPSVREDPDVLAYRGKEIVVGLRPESLVDATLSPPLSSEGRTLEGDVELVESLGAEKLVHFRIDAGRVTVAGATSADDPVAEESRAGYGEIGNAAATIGVARVDPASKIVTGSRARLTVESESIHLFDPACGRSVHGPDHRG